MDNLRFIDILKIHSKKLITNKLKEFEGPKDLIIDVNLIPSFDRILTASEIKNSGIDKIFKLDSYNVNFIKNSKTQIFIIKNDLATTKVVASLLSIAMETNLQYFFHILYVPRKLYLCEKLLEEEGVMGLVTMETLPVYLFPWQDDLFSMETSNFYKLCFIEGEETMLHDVSSLLVLIKNLFNNFNINYCGHISHMVVNLMEILSNDYSKKNNNYKNNNISNNNNNNIFKIDEAIIIDRNLDLVTPICSQVIYSGLLHEFFHPISGVITVDKNIVKQEKDAKIILNKDDKVFEDIKDRHFSHISPFLKALTTHIQENIEKSKKFCVKKTKEFVQNELKKILKNRNDLSLHINISEYIMNKKIKEDVEKHLHVEHCLLEGIEQKDCIIYIEEIMSRQVDIYYSLCLLCLLSLTEGGLSTHLYHSLSTQFLQSYGYQHLTNLHNLNIGAIFCDASQLKNKSNSSTTSSSLTPSSSSSSFLSSSSTATSLLNKVVYNSFTSMGSFRILSKKLNLIPKSSDSINLKDPNHISYVTSGAYSPLICSIIQLILKEKNQMKIDEVMKLLEAPYLFQQNKSENSNNLQRLLLFDVLVETTVFNLSL